MDEGVGRLPVGSEIDSLIRLIHASYNFISPERKRLKFALNYPGRYTKEVIIPHSSGINYFDSCDTEQG